MSKGAERLENEKQAMFEALFTNANIGSDIKTLVEKQYDAVFSVLCEKCDNDAEFDKNVCNPQKSWSACHKFMSDRAKIFSADGRTAMVADEIVFQWIYEYYGSEISEKPNNERKISKAASKSAKKSEKNKHGAVEVNKKDEISIGTPTIAPEIGNLNQDSSVNESGYGKQMSLFDYIG